jgi:polar amino acid transport system substrate-binding protein
MTKLLHFAAIFLVAAGSFAGEDTLAKIKSAGVLKWGADSSGGAPYVYNDPKDPNKVIGFEMDMMDKIAAHMGVKHERVQAEWGSLLENMKAKRTDIVMNGIEINELRSKTCNFSQPYFVYEQQISVRAKDKDKYKTLTDLKDKKIGILDGTESGNVLEAAGFKKDQITIHPDSKTPYDNLKLHRVDAVVAESIIAAFYAGQDTNVYNNPETFAPGKYAVAVRKDSDSDTLLAEIDSVLKSMKENGELAAIYKKWNIMSDKQKALGVVEK